MKIIDEKGRLFGKLNLIDLVVVLVIVAAIAAVGMKVFGNDVVDAVTSQKVTLTYEVTCQDVPEHVADYCEAHTGGQLLSSGNLLDAYITDCQVQRTGEGEDVQYDLLFTIEAHTTFSSATYAVGSQEVRVGKEHLVKTGDIEVEGIISGLEVTADE